MSKITNNIAALINTWLKSGKVLTPAQILEKLYMFDIANVTEKDIKDHLFLMQPEKRNRNPEAHEQKMQNLCVKYFKYQYPQYSKIFFHVPNGGSRNKAEAARLKMSGVTAGVADLILLLPRNPYHYLTIELKYGKGTQSEAQSEFEQQVKQAGGMYILVRSFEQFKDVIDAYINSTP